MEALSNLNELIGFMEPVLLPEVFVFYTIPTESTGNTPELMPVGTFREPEGLSLIVRRTEADRAGWQYSETFKLIRLSVHSGLNAVGLTAAVSGCLAEKGIACNMVASFHHDHVFVPEHQAEAALSSLQHLSKKYAPGA